MLVAFDTETTGFTYNHIVELAATITMDNGDRYQWYSKAKPSTPIEDGAAEVHGITNLMVTNERPDTTVVAEWWKDIWDLQRESGETLILSGHNVGYDIRAIRNYITVPDTIPILCTVRLGRKYTPNAENHKLGTLHDYLGLVGDYQAHSAMDDVFMHENILNYYANTLGKSYLHLASEQMQPIRLETMPIGKHKGSAFSIIPTSYLKYMCGHSDMDVDVLYSMQEELKNRKQSGVTW